MKPPRSIAAWIWSRHCPPTPPRRGNQSRNAARSLGTIFWLVKKVKAYWRSIGCHYHPYELAPTAAELLGWLDETAQIVTRMQEAITR